MTELLTSHHKGQKHNEDNILYIEHNMNDNNL